MVDPEISSASLGLPLGRFIDVASYDAINAEAWKRLPDRGHRELFSIAWGGLGYRARAAMLHAQSFDLLFDHEPAASSQERFQQDEEFFGFVTNAMAASETIVFGSFIIARAYDHDPIEEKEIAQRLRQMLTAIEAVPQTRSLGARVNAARSQNDGVALIAMRDVLLHRGRLPRYHWVGGEHSGKVTVPSNPKGIPSSWQSDRYFHAQALEPWCDWLARYISGAMPLMRDALMQVPQDPGAWQTGPR